MAFGNGVEVAMIITYCRVYLVRKVVLRIDTCGAVALAPIY